MSECERLESTFEAYVAGEIDETALGPLLVHCRGCEDCRRLLEIHRDLAGLASRIPEPDGADFDALQARILGGLARTANGRAEESASWVRLRTGRFPRVAAALAASLVLVGAGFIAGRASWKRAGADASLTAGLIGAMRADAASNRELEDVENSRFTYSNVSVRRAPGDRLALDFDVTTHVQLVEPVRSEIVRDVLAQALLNPTSTGARLRAMSLAAGDLQPKLKEALLFAMRRDESLAVRLEALAILSARLSDPEVESAVLATLRDDGSVQMRLLALDSLAARSVDRGRLREAIRAQERPGDEAVRVRLADYEKRL